MSDGDGILSGIADVAAGEIKKLGQSATSQVTGSDPAKGASSPASDSPAADQLKGFGKAITAQITGSSGDSSSHQKQKTTDGEESFLGELKKFGKVAIGQVSGHEVTGESQVAQMKKNDEEFSNREAEVVKAKIKRIYEEYAMKKKREEQQQEVVEQQEEQQKEQVKEVKKEESQNRAIAQTRAEIKNYGAE